jgi:cysteine desulfurase
MNGMLDMLGFKLEVPHREEGLKDQARPIYLDMQVCTSISLLSSQLALIDMQATTPVDPRVLDAMLPYLTDQYGNPHSRTHAYGWEAEKAIETAREVSLTSPMMNL